MSLIALRPKCHKCGLEGWYQGDVYKLVKKRMIEDGWKTRITQDGRVRHTCPDCQPKVKDVVVVP